MLSAKKALLSPKKVKKFELKCKTFITPDMFVKVMAKMYQKRGVKMKIIRKL